MINRTAIDAFLTICGYRSEDVQSVTFENAHVMIVSFVKTATGNMLHDQRTGEPVTIGRRYDWDGKPWHSQ